MHLGPAMDHSLKLTLELGPVGTGCELDRDRSVLFVLSPPGHAAKQVRKVGYDLRRDGCMDGQPVAVRAHLTPYVVRTLDNPRGCRRSRSHP